MHLEHNGAMLPVVYRSVLYLDVFGWSSQAGRVEVDESRTPQRNPGLTRSQMGSNSLWILYTLFGRVSLGVLLWG